MEGTASAGDEGGDRPARQLQAPVGWHGQKIPGGTCQGIQLKRGLACNRPLDAALLEVGNPGDPGEIRSLCQASTKREGCLPLHPHDYIAASHPEGSSSSKLTWGPPSTTCPPASLVRRAHFKASG